jgi:hypothetical protein
LVPRKGLEPSRPLSHWHLKPARLPIPPPGPGPVSKDPSRACQIANARQFIASGKLPLAFPGLLEALYSADGLAYRETAKYFPDRSIFDP